MKKKITIALLATAALSAGCTTDEPDDDVLDMRYQMHFGTSQGSTVKPDSQEQTYTIRFSTQHGTAPDNISVKSGSTITLPAQPALSSEEDAAYHFDGGFYNGQQLTGSHRPTSDETIEAQWSDQFCTLSIPSTSFLYDKVFIDGSERLYYLDGSIIINDNANSSYMEGEFNTISGRALLTGTYAGENTEWLCQFYIDNHNRFFMQIMPDIHTFYKSEPGLVGKWTRTDEDGNSWYTTITDGKFTNQYGMITYEFQDEYFSNNVYDGEKFYTYTFIYDLGLSSKKSKTTTLKNTKTTNQSQTK